jgi:hypothetical protein
MVRLGFKYQYGVNIKKKESALFCFLFSICQKASEEKIYYRVEDWFFMLLYMNYK